MKKKFWQKFWHALVLRKQKKRVLENAAVQGSNNSFRMRPLRLDCRADSPLETGARLAAALRFLEASGYAWVKWPDGCIFIYPKGKKFLCKISHNRN